MKSLCALAGAVPETKAPRVHQGPLHVGLLMTNLEGWIFHDAVWNIFGGHVLLSPYSVDL